jgi:hypothetical protein
MKTVIVTLFGLGAVGLVVLSLLSFREGARSDAVAADPVAADTGGGALRRRLGIPGLADIAGFVMAYRVGRVPVGRIAVLGSWWWVGWHFFAR